MDIVTFAFVTGYVILGTIAATAIISTGYQARARCMRAIIEANARCGAQVAQGAKAVKESLPKAVSNN